MLDEKDLQAIQAMLDAQRKELSKDSAHNMRVIVESDVTPKFNLLAEGIQLLNEKMDKMPTPEDMEIMDGRISVLESIVKRLSREVAELKQAR